MPDGRLDGVRRFDDRVGDYERYRPDYPEAIVPYLRGVAGLRPRAHVVDVGCGTGKLAQVFLAHGDTVVGVEPNADMRRVARRVLADAARFQVLGGRAEALPLESARFDAVVAGQAFHWFDPDRARTEFARVLVPGGPVVLIWNNRKDANSGFLYEYEALLQQHCPEYSRVGNKHYDEDDLASFYGKPPTYQRFDHAQYLDRAGLHGRLRSSSYVPGAGPELDAVLHAADALFERYAQDGRIEIAYDTELFHASLD